MSGDHHEARLGGVLSGLLADYDAARMAESIGPIVEKSARYWRLAPTDAEVAEAYLRFENLAHADDVMSIVEVVFREPWRVGKQRLAELFGDAHAWLPHTHVSRPRSIVFDVARGDALAIVALRVDPPASEDAEEWTVGSALVKRIHGPRRA